MSSRVRANNAIATNGSVGQMFVEHGRQIALTETRDDHDDGLSRVLWAFRELHGSRHGRPGGDPREDALLDRKPSRHIDGLGDIDVNDLVIDLAVENVGDEVRANYLNL